MFLTYDSKHTYIFFWHKDRYHYYWYGSILFYMTRQYLVNHIGGVMVNMLALSVIDCGFEPRLGQI